MSLTQDEIEHLWKVATNNPNHDTNWFDPTVVKFAELIAVRERKTCAEICHAVWRDNGGALECREKILRRAA